MSIEYILICILINLLLIIHSFYRRKYLRNLFKIFYILTIIFSISFLRKNRNGTTIIVSGTKQNTVM